MNKKLYIEFAKSVPEKREVHGYASTEALDAHDEIVEKGAIQKALDEFMKFANIREMHQPSAVGKALSAKLDDKGLFIVVKVVDDNAWKKVREGVYNGFSIGGRIVKQVQQRIKELRLDEISLVDRPANPEALFSLIKLEDNHTNMSEEKKEKDVEKQENIVVEASEEHKKEVAEGNAVNEGASPAPEEEKKPEVKEESKENKSEEKKEEKPKKRKKMVDTTLEKAELSSLIKSVVKDSLQEVHDEVKRLNDRLSKYEEAPSENKARASYVVKKESVDEGKPTAESLKENIMKNLSMLDQSEIDQLDDKTRNELFNL